MTAIASIAMLIFGLVMMKGGTDKRSTTYPPGFAVTLPEGNTSGAKPEPSGAPAAFQIVWVLACLGGLGYSIWNIAGSNAPAFETIREENDDAVNRPESDTASLLRELENLRMQGLISEDEFASKRVDVLKRFSQ